METLKSIYESLRPHAATITSTVALVITWVGLFFAWRRRKKEWARKEFLSQVNFSLNLFGAALAMRTLLEVAITDVWSNAHGVRLLHTAAARTTVADPFIRLSNVADRDYLQRAVKNSLSELCPTTFLAAALGEKVRTGIFLFAVTCERYPEILTVKLRVLLIEENTLREWCMPGGKAEQLQLSDNERRRLRTLQAMYTMDQKSQAGEPELLGRVELGVPVG